MIQGGDNEWNDKTEKKHQKRIEPRFFLFFQRSFRWNHDYSILSCLKSIGLIQMMIIWWLSSEWFINMKQDHNNLESHSFPLQFQSSPQFHRICCVIQSNLVPLVYSSATPLISVIIINNDVKKSKTKFEFTPFFSYSLFFFLHYPPSDLLPLPLESLFHQRTSKIISFFKFVLLPFIFVLFSKTRIRWYFCIIPFSR